MPLAKIISSKLFGGLENNLRTKAQKVLKEKALYDWLACAEKAGYCTSQALS